MSQPEEKLDNFSTAVLKDAQEQRSKILSQIEEYRKEQMKKAEEDILHDAYILIQNEIASIRNRQSKEISLAELDGRRKLLQLREELTGKVFDEAASLVLEFTKKAEYKDYICGLTAKSCASMPQGDVTIEVRKDDIGFADDLVKASGRKASVTVSPSITLGGVIITNRSKGIVENQTLDLKLDSQHDWFASASGLHIGD